MSTDGVSGSLDSREALVVLNMRWQITGPRRRVSGRELEAKSQRWNQWVRQRWNTQVRWVRARVLSRIFMHDNVLYHA